MTKMARGEKLKLTDIICRIISTDGVPVTLAERIWMNKLCSRNDEAKEMAGAMSVSYTHLTLPTTPYV